MNMSNTIKNINEVINKMINKTGENAGNQIEFKKD